MVLLVLGVTKAALSFAWFGEAKPLQNQVSLSAKPEGAELVLSYRTRTPFELEQALWFCLGAASELKLRFNCRR